MDNIERSIERSIEMSIDRSIERGKESERNNRSFTQSIGSSVDMLFSPMRTRNPAAYADEEELRWAALEKLPAYDQLRTSILQRSVHGGEGEDIEKGWRETREVDVRFFGLPERQEFIDRILKVAEEDNERLLKRLRTRFDRWV